MWCLCCCSPTLAHCSLARISSMITNSQLVGRCRRGAVRGAAVEKGCSYVRSDEIKLGVSRAPHRSLLRALGVSDAEMGRPFVGIANSFSEIVPGHMVPI